MPQRKEQFLANKNREDSQWETKTLSSLNEKKKMTVYVLTFFFASKYDDFYFTESEKKRSIKRLVM